MHLDRAQEIAKPDHSLPNDILRLGNARNLIQQNRLAHAPDTRQKHALNGELPRQTSNHRLRISQNIISTNQFWRARPRIGRKWIQTAFHDAKF